MKVIPKQPVSIVMPVCNEADVIEDVIEEWVAEVFRYLPEGSEIFFDEAASTDGTREILQGLQKKYPFIRVKSNPTKDGFAAAAKRLYHEARCPLIFFTDSDGQYAASEFWRLTPFIENFDVIHGARIIRHDPLYRKLASAIFNWIVRLTSDVYYSDINSAFRIVKKDVLDTLLPRVGVMPTLLNAELLLRAEFENYQIKQVWIRHRKRKYGKSRGLPASGFLNESIRAFRGVLALKSEYVL